MGANQDKEVYVRVKDIAGNEFICPLWVLKSVSVATEEELADCVDDATAQYLALGKQKIEIKD